MTEYLQIYYKLALLAGWKLIVLPVLVTLCAGVVVIIRKRRSSILKTKPRAPFAELEFNPPTPDGTSKSRRVSFSRRTAVAEFVFNEGTTTWRNVYEKQNRSLESSNNESDVGRLPAAASVHEQFHEVEAVMDCTTLGNPAAGGVRGQMTLFNDMNFTEQLASLDCMTSDNDLKAPTRNYEVSVMGESSKVFTESFGNPVIVERTGRIEVDFSMMQPVRACGSEEIDDLSDIESSIPSTPAHSSFVTDFNRSCYVEVDLNETKAGTSSPEISDMSITDTVQSPKVLAVSKNVEPAKKQSLDQIVDKENIVVQSFPKSTADCYDRADENVLVFDGKKLKLANINDKLDDILNEPMDGKSRSRPKLDTTNVLSLTEDILGCHTLAHERHVENVSQISDRQNINESNVQMCSTENVPVRKNVSHHMSAMEEMSLMGSCIENPTINITRVSSTSLKIQDFDDGLTDIIKPDVMKNANSKKGLNEKEHAECVRKTICQPNVPKRKTIILNHDDDLPNFTLDVPPQFDQSALKGSQKGLVYDTEDSVASMSTTHAILREIQEASELFKSTAIEDKRRTIVFGHDNTMSNLSMTHAVPLKHIQEGEDNIKKLSMTQMVEKRTITQSQTIVFDNQNQNANMSLTKMLPQNFLNEGNKKIQTIVLEKDDSLADISLTQAIPSKHTITQEKRKTIIFHKENDNANMSMTQAIPQNILDEVNKKRQTFVYNKLNDNANVSMTQAIPSKHNNITQEKRQTIVFDKENDNANMSMTQAIPQNILDEVNKKRQTFVYNKLNDNANVSMTQAIPSKHNNITQEKRQTIVFDKENDNANMSMTHAIPSKPVITQEKRQTIVFDKENDNANMSMTQAIPQNILDEVNKKKQNFVYNKENDNANMSMTQAISSKHISQEKRQTIVFDKENDNANMSMTQVIPQNILDEVNKKRQTFVNNKENDNANISMTQAIPSKHINQEKRQTIVFDKENDNANMSMTQAIPQNILDEVNKKKQNFVYNKENDNANMSMTQAISSKHISQEKRQTIVFDKENDNANMSMTQVIPQNILDEVNKKRQTFVNNKENDNANISMTQAIPSKHINQEKRQTILFDKENDNANMSMTQAIPSKHITREKRQTIVFDKENDNANMSMTQAIPSKYITQEKRQTIVFDKENDNANMSMTQVIPQNIQDEVNKKGLTLVYNKENDKANMSMIHAIPSKHITQDKRQTILFDKENDNASMSMTEATPQNVLYEAKTIEMDENNDLPQLSMTPSIKPPTDQWRATLFKQMSDLCVVPAAMTDKYSIISLGRRDEIDNSMTHPVKNNAVDQEKGSTSASGNNDGISMMHIPHKIVSDEKRKTIVIDKHDDMADMSITQAIPQKVLDEKHKTIVFDKHDDMADMSITQASPQKASDEQKRKSIAFDKHNYIKDVSITEAIPHNISSDKMRKTIAFDKHADLSITQVIPQEVLDEKRITILFDKHDDMADMSIRQVIPHKLSSKEIHQTTVIDETDRTVKLGTIKSDLQNVSEEKRKTVHETNVGAYMSTMTIVPQNIVSEEKHKTITFETAYLADMPKSQSTDSDSAHLHRNSKTSDSGVSSMLCDSKVSKLVNVVSVEESQIKSTVYEEVPKKKGKENQDISHEKEHFILLNKSIEQCIPKDIQLQINRDVKLVQDASKAGASKTNKSTSAHSKINKEQTSKRKTLLLQMVDLSNSENEQTFVDKTLGRTFGNVATDIALPKSLVGNIETDIDISCKLVTEKMEANDEPGTRCEDDNKKVKSSAIEINTNIAKPKNDNVKLNKHSSQKIHENFLNETRHRGQTAIDINQDSKSEKTANTRKDSKELNDTNDVLAMLTEAANEIESNLLNSANIRPTDSHEKLTKEYLDMMISDNLEDNKEEIDVDSNVNDEAEDVSQTESNEVVKKRLTIAYLLEQSEKIKSLNSTVNLVEKASSSDNIEEKDTNGETDANVLHKISVDNASINKTVRLSKEVVKTLNFEDESFQDEISNEKVSVAKKCNYNDDISIHRQDVTRVIPETIDNMDKIKDLMRDLVKPNADSGVIYEAEPRSSDKSTNVNKSILHRSVKQAQDIANVASNNSTMNNFEPALSSTRPVSTARRRHLSKTYSSDDKTFDRPYVNKGETNTGVRIFDAINPINNICLNMEVFNSNRSRNITETMESGTLSVVASVDKTTETLSKVIENKKVNTDIAMKNNEELLDNTSCITLVDDSINVSSNAAVSNQKCEVSVNSDSLKLPQQTADVMYMVAMEQKGPKYVESNRKRSLSPRIDDQQQNCSSKNLDLTPNPPRKMHKLSFSPNVSSDITKLEVYPHIVEQNMETTRSSELVGDTTEVNAVEKSMHVEANVANSNSAVPDNSDITEEIVSSASRPELVTDTSEMEPSIPLKPEFEAEIERPKVSDMQIVNVEVICHDDDKRTEEGAPQNVDLCESRLSTESSEENVLRYQESMTVVEEYKDNLISEIEDLPFMGTWRCEWERREPDWSFLLLHATIRMCVQFEQSDGTCVLADTPVRCIDVQPLTGDNRRSITSHCIAACVTALRWLANAGACARARDAPALLSRCASAVNDAARWARDMQHASLHLAYKLSGSVLTLQVANVPLRSVWEVSLRIEDGEDGPRATSVRVDSLCSPAAVLPEEVLTALRGVEPGWRNVPNTMRRIFKHLKYKTKEDSMMELIR